MPDEIAQSEPETSATPSSGANNYSRVPRMTYLIGLLIPAAIYLVLWIFYAMILGLRHDEALRGILTAIWGILLFIVAVYAMVLGIALAIKRFHDLDKSGWWILLMFIPIVNFFVQLWLLFGSGTPGTNKFGEAPVKRKLSDDLFNKLLTFGQA